eukprot:4106830-Prymnesium_polylepis.2
MQAQVEESEVGVKLSYIGGVDTTANVLESTVHREIAGASDFAADQKIVSDFAVEPPPSPPEGPRPDNAKRIKNAAIWKRAAAIDFAFWTLLHLAAVFTALGVLVHAADVYESTIADLQQNPPKVQSEGP